MSEEALLLDPEKWSSATEDVLSMYELHVPRFKSQLSVMAQLIPTKSSLNEIVEGLRSIHEETREIFAEVLNILRLHLVIPATSATAERSFSLLKRLESYLRPTRTQKRLNHLAILHCYQYTVDKIDVKALCREFCWNPYRVSVFGKAFE
ncbi:hypothetical protein PR048_003428 [Dryococelus australis]|uniref:HAT C-terminal dimerisation domain-containing protein n=1 Tax=Dryococelus australis TaxID=614101 RepID=A0ABQ9IN05_9NEOP|nr:hypothetical protein PR048_003428 [Dryococelus australis]